jgi:hypothetical protein
MKLSDLNPRWFVLHDGGPRVGFTFNCPHCQHIRLGVSIHDEGHRVISDQEPGAHPPGTVWNVVGGSDFHDISITPSVDASSFGHWHGMITNGEAL